MSGMTPQHPAALETETDANGLTEGERQSLNVAVDEAETCVCCGGDYGFTHVYAAVERIVAERVRVVEGERDAARVEACDLDHGWDDNPARVYGHYGSPRTCIRLRATDEWVYDPAWEDAR